MAQDPALQTSFPASDVFWAQVGRRLSHPRDQTWDFPCVSHVHIFPPQCRFFKKIVT